MFSKKETKTTPAQNGPYRTSLKKIVPAQEQTYPTGWEPDIIKTKSFKDDRETISIREIRYERKYQYNGAIERDIKTEYEIEIQQIYHDAAERIKKEGKKKNITLTKSELRTILREMADLHDIRNELKRLVQ